jgi:hypothetical protein
VRALLLLAAVGCTNTTVSSETLRNQGVISVDSRRYQSGTQFYGDGSVTAAFIREQTDPFVGCTERSFDACRARFDCKPVMGMPLSDGGANPYASAGQVTVEGLGMPIQIEIMTMGMFVGQYTVFQQFMPLFMGGEELTVSAAGDEVPAFATRITTPSQPTLTAPLPTNTPRRVPRGQDFGLSWTGGGTGELRTTLGVQKMDGTFAGIDCAWAAGLGGGVIPSGALQMLPAGQGVISFSVRAVNRVTIDAWQVQVTSGTAILQANGQPYEAASVILE